MPAPPNSPGGRLMWWITSRSTSQPVGRSSKLGEATKRAPLMSPAPVRCTAGSALGIELFLDAEPFHAIAQRAECDAQELGGRGAVVVGLLERVENRLALDGVQALLQRQAGDLLRRGRRPDARRRELQVLGLDLAARGERERALEHVLQLPHVARKIVLPQALQRRRGEPRRGAGGCGLTLYDRRGERRDIVAHLAQRRHLELDHVQAVVEVLAE